MSELTIAGSLETALAKDLGSGVRQIRHVLIDEVSDTVLVWIVVDDPGRDVRGRIFQKELELMDAFPQINFDFNIVPTLGRPIREIASEAKPVFSRAG